MRISKFKIQKVFLKLFVDEQDNSKTYLGENLRQRISDIYDVLHNSSTAEKEQQSIRNSYRAEKSLRNSISINAFNTRKNLSFFV